MQGHLVQKLAVCLSCAAATAAWAGPDWVEEDHGTGDAGNTTGTSQPTSGDSGQPLKTIKGKLGGVSPTDGVGPSDLEDLFLIYIDDPDNFNATTIACGSECDPSCGGCAEFNTTLWLFDVDGFGLLGNQFHFKIGATLGKLGGNTQGDSELDNEACDETGVVIDTPGLYVVGISQFNYPVSAPNEPIFAFDDGGSGCDFGEDSGPDGPGGDSPLTTWENNQDAPEGVGAEYVIFFEGVRPAVVGGVIMGMDIKPGGCPNPWNPGSNGVVPVSLCGTAALDISNVVLSSVRMSRPDGVGGFIGSIPPHEGPPGPHSTYGDSATPYAGEPGGCHTLEGDGFSDLNMKFKSQLMVDELQLNGLLPGALVEIVLRGDLTTGDDFIARDWIRLVPPNAPPGLLTVKSTVGRSWVDVNPPDVNLDAGGFGLVFKRTYPQSTVVVLQAQNIPGLVFKGWRAGNNWSHQPNANTLLVTINGNNTTVQALYEESAPVGGLSD